MVVIRLYYVKKYRRLNENISLSNIKETEGMFQTVLQTIIGLFVVAVILTYVLAPFKIHSFSLDIPNSFRNFAIIIGILSQIGTIWCHTALGPNWSRHLRVWEDQELITTGPYKYVRHPLYTMYYLLMINIGIVSANSLIMVAMLLLIISLYIRISTEETMLVNAFGEKYKEYMKTTGKLVPKI